MALLERHTQLAALAAAERDAARGQGSLVLVTGEAGAGKTVLLRRFASQSGARFAWGMCDELVTPRPLGPFRDMFAHLHGQPDPNMFFDAMLEELNAMPHPAVAIVEDAHWADRATLDAIRFIGRRISRVRALLVVTYRYDEVPADHALRLCVGAVPADDVRRIPVGPLSKDAVASMAEGTGVDAEKLYELTGGNPFYVTETLADPVASVPLSVQDAVMARVGRLGPTARACAEVASVIPGAADVVLLDSCGVLDGLDEAVQLGVLRVDGNEVTFSHELVRRSVEQSLTESRRHGVNGDVLDALAERGADPARLAHHAVHAGRAAAIIQYAPIAAQRASSMGAHLEAFEHYRRALRHADRCPVPQLLELLDQAAHAGYQAGRYFEVREYMARAVELTRASGDRAALSRSLRVLADIEWHVGRGPEAQAAANEAVDVLAGGDYGEPLANAYGLQARLAMLDHRSDEAVAWGEKAVALFEQDGLTVPADLLVTFGSARIQRDPDDAGTLVAALRVAVDRRDVHAAARAYINLGDELTLHMRYAEARPYLDEGLTFLERHDELVALDHLRAARARWHLDRGMWTDAQLDAELADGPDGPSTTIARLVLALLKTRRGDPAAGAAIADLADRARASAEAQFVIPAALAEAEFRWLAGQLDGVATALEPVLPAIWRSGMGRVIGEAALWLHRIGRLDEMPVGAAEPYALQVTGQSREAASAWRELGRPYEAADALADASDPELLLESLTILDRMNAEPRAAMVRRHLVELGMESVPRGPRAATRSNPAGLTARQVEVLRLLSAGLTYRSIADRLHVSVKTVDHHATAIRTKLGVASRAQAVDTGLRLGILP
jgi:DNA-binding CsgD family transcriptional regulator/tetratricopeptide (TPR) repeat protein